MYKSENSLLPKSLHNIFELNNHNHAYDTRNANDPRIIPHRTQLINSSFLIKIPSIWNILPRELKVKQSLKCFKKHVKIFLIERQ